MLSNHKKHKSHKTNLLRSFCSFCVFVPFVAIPSNDPATESCKRLNSSIRLLVFIRVNSWFVVPLRESSLPFVDISFLPVDLRRNLAIVRASGPAVTPA